MIFGQLFEKSATNLFQFKFSYPMDASVLFSWIHCASKYKRCLLSIVFTSNQPLKSSIIEQMGSKNVFFSSLSLNVYISFRVIYVTLSI